MSIPRQAQEIAKFLQAGVSVCAYDPDDLAAQEDPPRISYKEAGVSALTVYCQESRQPKPQYFAELEFKDGQLTSILCYRPSERAGSFENGLQLIAGLAELLVCATCAADAECNEVSFKVNTVKKGIARGVILGPVIKPASTYEIKNYAKIAEFSVDQQTGTLLRFNSLYKS